MLFGDKKEPEQKDGLKEAFAKVKNDIFSIGNEFSSLKSEIFDVKSQLNSLFDIINSLRLEISEIKSYQKSDKFNETSPLNTPTVPTSKPSEKYIPSNTPTVPVEMKGLKYQNLGFSSGNEGVPTDKQTHQPTDTQPLSLGDISNFYPSTKPLNQQIQAASEILTSLDSLKKEIRLKFKQMTQQEMLVFSTIYQLEEQFPEGVEYRQIASRLRLSESSIRDYTQKLIFKGIPVDKIKLNNKKILLRISSKLKNLASLETIMKLREL